MAIINTVRPVLPWTRLVEKGVLSDQFECANPSDPGPQLTIGQVNGKPALRLLVDNASKYGNSSWLRALGRLTAPDDHRFVEGSTVAVAKQVTIPVAQILDGATVIDEAHGPGGDVAPVRLIVRPDGNLYAAFNGGEKVGAGYTGWRKEQLVGPFTLGIEHELVYSITFHRDPAKGRLAVMLDGRVLFDEAGATGQVVNGVWQHPYLLSGIYVASASTPVVCFIHGIVVADDAIEARRALQGLLGVTPTQAPDPQPAPDYVTHTELEAFRAALLDANASRDAQVAGITARVDQAAARLAAVKQAADQTKTAAFSKALRALWPA